MEWSVSSDDGRTFDAHYRFGELLVWERPHDYDDRTTMLRANIGDEYAGDMEDAELLEHLRRLRLIDG